AIELFSATAVLWRFRTARARAEATATKITGWLLVALAVFIPFQSRYTLFGKGSKPQPSYLGIVLLVAAALVMPWLGHRKRQLAAAAQLDCSTFYGRFRLASASGRQVGHRILLIQWDQDDKVVLLP